MATLDVITVQEARVAAGYSPGDQNKDLRLAPLVTAISLKIDELCGPVIQRSVTERLDGGFSWVKLRRRPLSAISSVTEYASGVATTLTAETLTAEGQYLAERRDDDAALYTGFLWRRSGFYDTCWAYGRQNVVVVATAGRYVDTDAAEDSIFAKAARLAVKASWAGELNGIQSVGEYDLPVATFPGAVLPKVAVDLLAAEMQQAFTR